MRQSEEAPEASTRRSVLSRFQLAAFGFPALPHAFIALPLNIVIPAYYAAHSSVTLLQIGLFTSSSRLLDAFLDPLVGFLSDRIDTPWGKRKPWGVAAGLVCGVALFFLFQPPPNATIYYYGLWSFLLYFGFSLFEIPRSAWSTEISRDYSERTRINSYIAQFNISGSLLFWLMPLALAVFTRTTQITGASLSAIAWLYAILMPIALILAARVVPRGKPDASRTLRILDLLRSIAGNRPLLAYLAAYALWAMGQGVAFSVTMLFLSDRMGLAALFPVMMIMHFAATIVGVPVWDRLVPRIGRHRVWALSLLLSALTKPLVLLVAPGPGAAIPLLFLTSLSGFLTAPWNFAPPAMLSDVIDYDLWRSRTNKGGNLFALNTLLVKAAMAIGAGSAFAILDRFHYHAGRQNAGDGEAGLLLCYILIPGLLHAGAAFVGWSFPLNERRQRIVRRRLDARAASASS